MLPECEICGALVPDENKHSEWHDNLRKILQGLVNSTYGHGFEETNVEVAKV